MMNMAISLDPLSAERALGRVNHQQLQKQKEAMEPAMNMIIKANQHNRDEKHADTPADLREASTPNDGYSQDEFESDEIEDQV